MGIHEFLLAGEIGEDTMEVEISPFPFPFVVKSVTEAENKQIRKSCQKIDFDKKTRQKTTEMDTDQYNNRLIVACCVEPNFKDAALQEKYGVRGAEALIDVLLKPGQYTDLLLAVQDINGFSDDINILKDEAKNLSSAEMEQQTMPTTPYID